MLLLLPLFFGDEEDEADGLVVGEVAPDPFDQDHDLVLDAKDRTQVDAHPDQPGDEAVQLYLVEVGYSFVAADGGKGSEVFVVEGFQWLAAFDAFQVGGKQFALLDGYLCHLWVAVRIVRLCLQADIADGENISRTMQLVVFVD